MFFIFAFSYFQLHRQRRLSAASHMLNVLALVTLHVAYTAVFDAVAVVVVAHNMILGLFIVDVNINNFYHHHVFVQVVFLVSRIRCCYCCCCSFIVVVGSCSSSRYYYWGGLNLAPKATTTTTREITTPTTENGTKSGSKVIGCLELHFVC